MSLQFCIDADQLRAALKEIEAAERNGFQFCLAVFGITQAGHMIDECRATYSDLLERAGETPDLNWGRHQAVTKRHLFTGGKLVPLGTLTSTQGTKP